MAYRRRLLALVVLASIVLALGRAPVQAHAVLVRSDPTQNARLTTPPQRIDLFFSEALNRQLSTIHLLDTAGRQQQTSAPQFGADPTELTVTVGTLAPGYYTVSWVTVSAVDGHRWDGTFPITLLKPDGSAPPGAPRPAASGGSSAFSVFDPLLRWLLLLGLIGVIGGFGFATLVLWPATWRLPASVRSSGQRWVLELVERAVPTAAVIVLIANLAVLLRDAELAGSLHRVDAVLSGRAGVAWVAREVLALAAGLLAWATPRWNVPTLRRHRYPLLVTGLLLSLGSLVTMSLTAHAAAGRGTDWAVPSDFFHLTAVALWLGCLVQLPFLLRSRAMPPGEARLCFQAGALRRFSTLAAGCVSVILLTGVFNALVQIPSGSALLATDYGRTLLIKLGFIVPLLGLGLLNAAWVSRRFERQALTSAGVSTRDSERFLRRAVAESIAGALVLAATAVLVVLVPATAVAAQNAARAASTQPAPAFQQTTKAADLTAAVSISPNQVGDNTFQVQLTGPDLDKVERVQFRLQRNGSPVGRSTIDAQAVAGSAGLFTAAGANLSLAGRWQLTVNVRRSGHDDLDATVTDALGSPSEDRSPTAFPAHGSTPVAAWLALTLLAGWLLVLLRRPRLRRPPTLLAGSTAPAALVVIVLLVGAAAGKSAPSGTATHVAPEQTGATLSWRVPTPGAGLMMPAVGPDGRVWVGEMSSNKLAVLDPTTNRYTEFTLPGPGAVGVMGVAVDAQNRVWLALNGAQAIGVFDAGSKQYRQLATPTLSSGPSGIALDGRGRVWFTELGANKVGLYDPTTRTFREYPIPAANFAPYWLSVAPDGRVWFTNISGNSLGVLAPDTGHIDLVTVAGIRGTTGIDVGTDGTVWFATTSGQLGSLEPGSGQVSLIPVPRGQPYGVAVDAHGTVWLASTQANVAAYDPSTKQFHTLATAPGAWWLAVAADGAVWVAEADPATDALGRITANTATQAASAP